MGKPKIYMKGLFAAIRVVDGHQVEVARVQAIDGRDAANEAARRLGIPAEQLDTVAIMPTVYMARQEAARD